MSEPSISEMARTDEERGPLTADIERAFAVADQMIVVCQGNHPAIVMLAISMVFVEAVRATSVTPHEAATRYLHELRRIVDQEFEPADIDAPYSEARAEATIRTEAQAELT